ncbi:lipase [Marinomonas sp. SBI22]|uniref:alpha/beta hydrolase n=1 Tax=unclassified Marinomonas TaxID=196814 RepID=UPI0007AF7392|nr:MULTISPECIES: alpha/beta hydrolase [unclassified Marinomonas]KZM39947.1 lipase [Marinomonas sp. SBI22]KZM41241.1 lipase [Marinomonas sp. SBI8L]
MLDRLEEGIRPLVEDFISAGKPCSSELSIEDRRTGYIASTSLADTAPQLFAEYEIRLNGINMKIYQPLDGTDLPLCIYFHGGCFVSGGFLTHDPQLRELAHQSGCIFVCIEYRLAPEHIYPAAHDDAYFGSLAIKEHARRIGGNANEISFMGDSAGGHLALITALRLKNKTDWLPNKLALIYPMLDPKGLSPSYSANGSDYIITSKMLLSGFELYLGDADYDEQDSELNVLMSAKFEGLPPTYIVTAEYDPLLDEGLLLSERLKVSGVEVKSETYPGVIHGFFQLSGVSKSAVNCIHSLSEWISEY